VDKCIDDTYAFCKKKYSKVNHVYLLDYGERFGSASSNFFHLFRKVDFSGFDYICLSDQDDIWEPYHLENSIKTIIGNNCDGVSSNLRLIYKNSDKKVILNKSQKQTKYDYFFGSIGAGCTFVISHKLAIEFKNFAIKNVDKLNYIFGHDWVIYAFARSNNFLWVARNEVTVNYRQHENNSLGANFGITAKISRFHMIKSGWYKDQVVRIINVISPSQIFLIKPIKRILNFWSYRRSVPDKFLMLLIFISGLFDSKK